MSDTAPKQATLIVNNGVLGKTLTLTVPDVKDDLYYTIYYEHSIKVECGDVTLYIKKDGSTSTSEVMHTGSPIQFTPPISWASQNTTGTSVTVKFTINTYEGVYPYTYFGSNSYTATFTIPDNIAPTCALSVSDATPAYNTYGYYVAGISKLNVAITPTLAYGSEIDIYKTTVNAEVYYGASFTTSALSSQKSLQTINATVTDQRGRLGSASQNIVVYAYSAPKITSLKVHRCGADGKEDDEGKYVQVTYSGEITTMSNTNGRLWELYYKKTTEEEDKYQKVTLNTTDYKLSNETYIFEADTEYSYDVKLSISDSFYNANSAYGLKPVSLVTSVSTAFTIMDFGNDGRSVAFGKVAELKDVFDVGFKTRPMGGYLQPVLEDGFDLDLLFTPNTYTLKNAVEAKYGNCPTSLLTSSSTGVLKIESCGEDGQLRQTITLCNSTTPCVYERFYYINSEGTGMTWYPWKRTTEVVLYNDTTGSNSTITLPETSANFKYIDIFYTDNGGRTGGYTRVYSPNGKIVCLSIVEAAASSYTYIRRTSYTFNGTSLTPDTTLAGYALMTGTTLSHTIGTNYIKIKRVVGYE